MNAFAVIGDPIEHSWSPRMHTAALEFLGRPERYETIRVPVGEVEATLERLRDQGYLGVNVTVPHKERALAWAREADELARRCGAANTLRLADRAARNTDAPAVVHVLRAYQVLPPAEVLVLGAGGAARAALVALSEAGYRPVGWNRSLDRMESLLAELGIEGEVDPKAGARAATINATSASLVGEAPPVLWEAPPGSLAFDMMYGQGVTPFLAQAQTVGMRIVDGREMLVEQGALALEWWLGIEAPRTIMREALPA